LYFDHINWGTNGKNTDLQASIGLVEVKKFEKIFDRRKYILYRYIDATKSFHDLAIFTEQPEDCMSAPHAFNIIMKKEGQIEELKQWLSDANIECKRTFGCIPTQHRAFRYFDYSRNFPIAEYIGNNSIHIGLSQYYTDDEIQYVCNSLRDFFLRA
jgi:dTDP-4-amino-4,6-dideoxygalactose transaminase